MKIQKQLVACALLTCAVGIAGAGEDNNAPVQLVQAMPQAGYIAARLLANSLDIENDGPLQAGFQGGGAAAGAAAAAIAGAKIGGKIGVVVGGLPGLVVGAALGAV